MYTFTKYLISALAALLLCLGQGALLAADTAPDGQRSVTVHYRDLNLDRPADVARLYHRIAEAAASVCGARDLHVSQLVPPVYAPCISAAIARAVAQVDQPALSAYHERQVALDPLRYPSIAQR
jgi:UrcA family protein